MTSVVILQIPCSALAKTWGIVFNDCYFSSRFNLRVHRGRRCSWCVDDCDRTRRAPSSDGSLSWAREVQLLEFQSTLSMYTTMYVAKCFLQTNGILVLIHTFVHARQHNTMWSGTTSWNVQMQSDRLSSGSHRSRLFSRRHRNSGVHKILRMGLPAQLSRGRGAYEFVMRTSLSKCKIRLHLVEVVHFLEFVEIFYDFYLGNMPSAGNRLHRILPHPCSPSVRDDFCLRRFHLLLQEWKRQYQSVAQSGSFHQISCYLVFQASESDWGPFGSVANWIPKQVEVNAGLFGEVILISLLETVF